MQSATITPAEPYPVFEMYVDPDLSNDRTVRKLVRRKFAAKISLEDGPTSFDELVIAVGIMSTPKSKRARRLNGIRIELNKSIERFGPWYGRWFFTCDVAKDTGAARLIARAGSLLRRLHRLLGLF